MCKHSVTVTIEIHALILFLFRTFFIKLDIYTMSWNFSELPLSFVYILGLYIQAQPSMLILDGSSNEAYLCWAGLNGLFLLLVSHYAEVFCYLQPFSLLSVSTINWSLLCLCFCFFIGCVYVRMWQMFIVAKHHILSGFFWCEGCRLPWSTLQFALDVVLIQTWKERPSPELGCWTDKFSALTMLSWSAISAVAELFYMCSCQVHD